MVTTEGMMADAGDRTPISTTTVVSKRLQSLERCSPW
jgi:hypothetical protein